MPPESNATISLAPGRFSAAGRRITCPHCENDVFVPGIMPLGPAGIRMAGVNTRGKQSALLMCADCTRFLWFGQLPQRVGEAMIEHGQRGVEDVGHRKSVGGLWDQMGKLQFEFLLQQGLKPHHYLLDIACGSLRAGVHFIPYLEPGHYLGLEKEQKLIDAGLQHELPEALQQTKQPQLVVSDCFEFEKFGQKADFALAQSLFSHLPPSLIDDCLTKLRPHMAEGGAFYATFFESAVTKNVPERVHDHQRCEYTREEMLEFGRRNGWHAQYIGNWKHPRGQVMVRYSIADV